MKTLIIGSGAREHAIAWALRKANSEFEIHCAPGNAGVAELAQLVSISPSRQQALIDYAKSKSIDLTIVGPEVPLAEGLVDAFQASGLEIFGPNRKAAQLEASKVFAKNFMARNKIPTAEFKVASSTSEAVKLIAEGKFGSKDTPVVVKADGLAAGKGVIVAASRLAGENAVKALARSGLTGPDHPIVLEEALVGREVSILVFANGTDYVLMPPARDHKRIGENETGPNTGGMGSITDASIVDPQMMSRITTEIIEPTLNATAREGFSFKGVLFFGLMLTNEGPMVLEYNVRFGDPETQAILVRLKSNLWSLFQATCKGTLGQTRVEWDEGASACVVLANRGYPLEPETGAVIHGLSEVHEISDVEVFHAGTGKSEAGELLATGGRVLAVTAKGSSLHQARERCYSAVQRIHWEGMQFRQDIGGAPLPEVRSSKGAHNG